MGEYINPTFHGSLFISKHRCSSDQKHGQGKPPYMQMVRRTHKNIHWGELKNKNNETKKNLQATTFSCRGYHVRTLPGFSQLWNAFLKPQIQLFPDVFSRFYKQHQIYAVNIHSSTYSYKVYLLTTIPIRIFCTQDVQKH